MYAVEAVGGQFGADWNGGHTFSQSAVDFSMQEYIEPEVVRKNPHLSPAEVRFEASRVLTLRLAQDLSFDRKETLRDEEMVTKWEVADIDGKKQLVTRYGDRNVSLEELWRHTEEFALRVGKPGAFNRAEMQTQLAIQDALIAGRATSAAFTLSHPESVRYVQQWQRREDGAFYSKQLDIGKHAGRDLRHDEVKEFLDSFRDLHRDTAIEVEGAVAGSYVAVRGTLDIAAIRRTAKLHTMTTGGEQFLRRHPTSDPASWGKPDLSDRAFPLWVIADRRWFGEHKKESPLFFDRIRDKEKKDTLQSVRSINKQEKPLSPRKSRLRQEVFSDGTPLQNVYEVRQTARSSLQIIVETGVAVHAAPVIIATLAEKLPPTVSALKKSIERHEKKVRRREEIIMKHEVRKAKREKKKGTGKTKDSKQERIELEGKTQEKKKGIKHRKVYMGHPAGRHIYTFERQKKRLKENSVKRVAVAEKLTPIERKKSVNPERVKIRRLRWVARRAERVLEAKRAPKKERKLWVVLAVASAELTSKESVLRGWPEERPKRAERVVVAGVRFAWALWILFHENAKKRDPDVRWDDKTVPKQERIKVLDHNPTPWILLSIIYYLTAIREQGMHNTSNSTNTTNHQMKKRQDVFPEYGVIFTHVS